MTPSELRATGGLAVSNDASQATSKHWAYRLPEMPGRKMPYWARETVAEHKHPEYWAWMWGWHSADIAKAHGENP